MPIATAAQGQFPPLSRSSLDVPVAGSAYNGPLLMGRLFSSQTQKWNLENDPLLAMNPAVEQGVGLGLGYLNGQWDLKTPAIVSGFIVAVLMFGMYRQTQFIYFQF